MKNSPSICTLIVTYNGTDNVEKQISEYSGISSLVVVDNGSNSNFVDSLKQLNSRFHFELILNNENKGLSCALNQGLDYALKIGAKYLLTMDQDSFIDGNTIKKLMDAFEFDKSVVSVGPYYGETCDNTTYVNYLITSGNIIDVEVLNKLGGYDNNLFIDNIDIEISFRLLVNGYKMVQVGGTSFNHKIGEMERSRIFKIKYYSHSPERFYWMYRNERYLIRKYKKSLPYLCFKSRVVSILYLLKVLFVERNRFAKIKKARIGWKDGKNISIERA